MEKLTKARQIFLIAAPFPAMVFFKIWAGSGRDPGSVLICASAMFLYCCLVIVIAYRLDRPGYFDWAIAAYFAVVSCFLALLPEPAGVFLANYAVTGIYVCLFLTAIVPLLLGMDPFTYHYAKKFTPRDTWGNPIFVTINRIMTWVWGGIFAACIVLSLYPSIITRAFVPISLIVGLGLPFNLRFPDYYLGRLGLPTLPEQRRLAEKKTEIAQPIPSAAEPEAPMVRDMIQINRKKEDTMKVLALNSSPRGGGQSKTELMLTHLVEGMVGAGASVDVVNLKDKTVRNCIGCYSCWTKTPGVCVHKDDMTNELFPRWLEADVVVYATPLYHFTMNATLKAFIERTLPELMPYFAHRDGITHHPQRHKRPRIVMLSVAGFPQDAVFDQLSSHMNYMFGEWLVAEIYRPLAEVMTQPYFQEKAGDILDAVQQAGREIVESLKVSPETMARIKQPIVENYESFLELVVNPMWKTCIAEGITPREMAEKGIIPRPDSIESFMMIMPMGFNAGAAGDKRAVIQFHFSGEVEGACYLKIEDGKIEAAEGEAGNADLTIETPFEVWMDISSGKADGQQLFMEQKYKVAGDLSLLIQMHQLFGG